MRVRPDKILTWSCLLFGLVLLVSGLYSSLNYADYHLKVMQVYKQAEIFDYQMFFFIISMLPFVKVFTGIMVILGLREKTLLYLSFAYFLISAYIYLDGWDTPEMIIHFFIALAAVLLAQQFRYHKRLSYRTLLNVPTTGEKKR
ncbi:hypothetical protein [Robertkochia aurantiaca]|uniref:hypothetical protein n=1 Tax=Robertkochia aurantiaca TaxID=2873700 RepID=UPI001CCA32FF|nr:hypothetical protein [Robertkochia sp. 3YJGBD-33]